MPTPQENLEILKQIRQGNNSLVEMQAFLNNLPDEEYNALADYSSSINPVAPDAQTIMTGSERGYTVNPDAAPQAQVPQATVPQGTSDPENTQEKGFLDNGFGLTLRAGAQGAAALPTLALNALPYVNVQEGIDTAFDSIGAARPNTPGERLYSDVVGGVAGAAGTAGTGALLKAMLARGGEKSLSNVALTQLAKRPGLEYASGGLGGLGAGVAREQGASEEGQILAGLLAGLSPQGISGLSKKVLTSGAKPEQLAEILQNFETAGTTPRLGQLTGGKHAQAAEGFLSDFYGSSGQIRDFDLAQEAAFGKTLAGKAEELGGNISNKALGDMLAEQYTKFGKPAIRDARETLQSNLADNVSPNALVDVGNYEELIDSLSNVNPALKHQLDNTLFNPNAKDFGEINTSLKKDLQLSIDNQVQAGVDPTKVVRGLPFQAVRELKTRIGQQLDNSVFGAKTPADAELRRLTGALTEDIKSFVKGQGAEAEAAFNKMNAWEVQYHKDAKLIRSVLDKNGGPEAVYNSVFSGATKGPSTINAVYSVLPPSGKRVLTGSMIRRLGESQKSNPKDFDLQSFYTNYSKLDPEAKQAIFGHLGQGYLDDMDKIYEASKIVLKGGKEYGKTSGAGRLGIHSGLGILTSGATYANSENVASSLAYGAAAISATVLGSNVLAKYMTNPNVVRWLASNNKLPPSTFPSAVNILVQSANNANDPDFKDFADELEASLKGDN